MRLRDRSLSTHNPTKAQRNPLSQSGRLGPCRAPQHLLFPPADRRNVDRQKQHRPRICQARVRAAYREDQYRSAPASYGCRTLRANRHTEPECSGGMRLEAVIDANLRSYAPSQLRDGSCNDRICNLRYSTASRFSRFSNPLRSISLVCPLKLCAPQHSTNRCHRYWPRHDYSSLLPDLSALALICQAPISRHRFF